MGWAVASLSAKAFSGLLLYGDRVNQEMAGLPCFEAYPSGTLCHFVSSNRWYTGIAVANPDPLNTAHVTLTGYNNTGTLMGTPSFDVPPMGKVSKLVTDPTLFGNVQDSGWMHLSSDRPVSAFEIYGDMISGGIAALPVADTSRNLYFPHFIYSARWWTGLAIANPWASDLSVTLTAYTADGVVIDDASLTIGPYGKWQGFVESVLSLSPGDSGWIKAVCSDAASGILIYGDKQAVPNQIGALVADNPIEHFEFTNFYSDANWWTGLTMVNPDTSPANVTLTAYEPDGTLIQTVNLAVSGLHKYGGMVNSIFSLGEKTAGWIDVQSPGVALVGLEMMHGDDSAANAWGLAAIEGQRTYNPRLYMPHYDVGSRWWTRYGIANPNADEADWSISGYANDGHVTGFRGKSWMPAYGQIMKDVKTLFGITKQ